LEQLPIDDEAEEGSGDAQTSAGGLAGNSGAHQRSELDSLRSSSNSSFRSGIAGCALTGAAAWESALGGRPRFLLAELLPSAAAAGLGASSETNRFVLVRMRFGADSASPGSVVSAASDSAGGGFESFGVAGSAFFGGRPRFRFGSGTPEARSVVGLALSAGPSVDPSSDFVSSPSAAGSSLRLSRSRCSLARLKEMITGDRSSDDILEATPIAEEDP
jgi:hypothetical protein